MGNAHLMIDGDILKITVDLARAVPQLRQWQDAAQRAQGQWEESQWYLGEARSAIEQLQSELRSVGEAYHALQEREQDTLAHVDELRRQRDESNWLLNETQLAEERSRTRIRELNDELVQAQDALDAVLRSVQEMERRLDLERARRRALEAELAAVRNHGERRRGSRRHRADVHVELQAPDGTLLFRGPSRNISSTGLSVASDRPLEGSELLQVRLQVSGSDRPIEAIGRLAWQAQNGTCLVGCQLLDLPTGCLDTLERALGEDT
jgi:hypothetical protein